MNDSRWNNTHFEEITLDAYTPYYEFETEFERVTCRCDAATADDLYWKMLEFFKEHQAFSGEVIHDKDSVIRDAYTLLSECAENIFKFKVEEKE